MEKVQEQLEIFKRVIGEAQDASQDDYAFELLPISKTLESAADKDDEELIEILEAVIASFQTVFASLNVSKWTNKVLRTKKKKFKSDEEKIAFLTREVCHCISCSHIVSLILGQDETPDAPVVLWVDDAPENNMEEREKAVISHGVEVVLARSTAEAMTWLSENKAEYQNLGSAFFRIITDWYRPDEKDEAAESLIKAVREAGWECPVLVYCSESTNPSSLLASQSHTSTTSSDHLLAFYWASMKLNVGSTVKNAKKGTAKKVSSRASSTASSKASSSKAPSASSSTVSKTKNVENKTVEEEMMEHEPLPIPSISKAKKSTSTTSSTSKKTKSTASAAPIAEEDDLDDSFELPAPKAKKGNSSASVAKEKGKSTTSVKMVEVVEEEKSASDDELPATMELDNGEEKDHKEEDEPLDATLPSDMGDPVLEKVPTDIIAPAAVPSAKSSIHDILASRIPQNDDLEGTEEDDSKMDLTIEEPLPPIKKVNSDKKSSSVSKGSSSKPPKKTSKQMFGDDDDSDFLDDGAKEDVGDDSDFMISDGDEEGPETPGKVTKSSSKTKPKKSASKSDSVVEVDAVSAAMTPGTKQKKDWNAFLMSRVPSVTVPGSPLSLLDDSTDTSTVDHLIATPPAKKPVKKSISKKSSTSIGLRTPPTATPTETPQNTPQVSPVEKPRPPKPSAPIAPAPISSLNILDDDDEEEDFMDQDEELPLFTKAPSGPPLLPLASSSNASENLINPARSMLLGMKDTAPIGKVSEVLLQAKNKDGLNINIGGANVTVVLRTGGNAHEFDGYVEDNMNGTYSIKFFPTRLGTYRMIVQANNQHITGSPFSIDIENPGSKKRTASANMFVIDDSIGSFGSPIKKLKHEESSLPDIEYAEEEIEATQVV